MKVSTSTMPPATPMVFVVDDDISVRESLPPLFAFVGWASETFASAEEFLAHPRQSAPSCLILDVRLPDLDGLELQNRLAVDHAHMPIIFITGHGSVPMTVRAMKAGAAEFLTKPFADEELIGAIRQALERSAVTLQQANELQALRDRYATLRQREREVLGLVVAGLPNKLVAAELGISEVTVKAHRGQAMRKMKADSFAALVNMAGALGIGPSAKA
jgi:FixJ family two-component response regulator